MKFIFQQNHCVWRTLKKRYWHFTVGLILFALLNLIGSRNPPEFADTNSGITEEFLSKINLEIVPNNVSSNRQLRRSPSQQELNSKDYSLAQQFNPDNIWQNASFPLENFQAYTSPFGIRSSPDSSTESELHYGLDMAAPEGSYVRNWWSGQVIEVSDNTNCGTSAVIQSGEWIHKYCHMSGYVEVIEGQPSLIDPEGSIQLQQDQLIPAGFRIGRVGMTGRTTGPHLHWILKYGSNWVDPGLVLQAMYAAQQLS